MPRRNPRRWLAALLAAASASAACGSALSEPELAAANGSLTVQADGQAIGPGATQPVDQGDGTVVGGAGETDGGAATATTSRVAEGGQAPGQGDQPGAKDEILLGSFGTGSGIVGQQVGAIPVAVKAWVADVNARGGLNGHPVRVIFGDDGNDPSRTLAIVRRMVEEDKVVAFIGAYAALTMQAATPYLESKRVPVIGTTGGNPADDSPMVFSTVMGADIGVGRQMLTTLVAQSDAKKVALVYCQEAASCTQQAQRNVEYAPTLGVEIVSQSQTSIAQPDFTAEVVQARRAGAEAVLMVSDYASVIRYIRSAHRQGWRPLFVSSAAVNEESFLQAGGPDVEGVLTLSAGSVPYFTPKMADYRRAVEQYVPGGTVGGTGAGAWVAGKLLERIAPMLDDDPTSDEILEALYSLKDERIGGLSPPLTFPRGSHERVNLCLVPTRVQGGAFVAPLGDDAFFCGFDGGVARL